MRSDSPDVGPLEGVRVLDCSRVMSGPICGRMLADLGADVVKIEAPESDFMRATQPRIGGFGAMYAQLNAGKRCVGLDLKAPGGAALLARLADVADVLLENFRPGVLERFGLGAEQLLERNPRLVYASITGWGQTGPRASRPAYAPIVQAEAGTVALDGKLRGATPIGETQQHADVYAGLMACNAITAALFERERSGVGQHLDIAMAESLLYVNEHAAMEFAGYTGPRDFDTWTFGTYRLANGRSVHVLGNPGRLFGVLAGALGMSEALEDPRFASPDALAQHSEAAAALLCERLARVPDQAALEALLVDLPLIVVDVCGMDELAESDWARWRGLTSEPVPGLRVPRAPWRSDRAAIGNRAGLAQRGANNREVLRSWLGMDDDACARAEAAGVLGTSDGEQPSLDDVQRRPFRER
ncbi:MAG: CoA transferase [Deltaproteobacteria bacterium]|nr:CoA transferase [Deltaproteobacteria bacterium]MBW2361018.1 CoA transferase [Deltaproteobacteria bacterium]